VHQHRSVHEVQPLASQFVSGSAKKSEAGWHGKRQQRLGGKSNLFLIKRDNPIFPTIFNMTKVKNLNVIFLSLCSFDYFYKNK